MSPSPIPFRILLIEDNELDREFFRECLNQFHEYAYEFAEGVSGKSAAELCRQFSPDCLILDYNLPHSDGLKVLRELHDENGAPTFPVVMLTGRGDERIAVNSLRLGAQDYLVKAGITPESLHRAVHNAHDRFHLAKNLRAKNRELEESLRQLRTLQEITAALAAGAHLSDVAEILVSQGREMVGPDTAIVLRSGEVSGIKVLASHAYEAQDIAQWEPKLPAAPLPVADALLNGREFYFENPAEMRGAFPEIENVRPMRPLQSFVALPLRQRHRIVAAVGFGFKRPRTFDENEKVYLSLLLRTCADALERASLYELEIKRKEDLGHTVKLREEFLSIASHELKTPLTALKLQLQLARRGINPETGFQPEARRTASYFDSALKQVGRLSDFINDLLDVSRISSGKLILEREPVDLCRLVDEVAGNFRDQLEKAGNRLRLHVEENCVVLGDLFRTEQVLNNLFSNVIKYAPGVEIEITIKKVDSQVKIEFRDHGPGIPTERIPFIFDRYERATNNNRISGLGLGLYITRQLVEAQRGSIRVESGAGEGTAFYIELPKAA